MSKYDWSKVYRPKDRWIATDADGNAFAWEGKPEIVGDEWNSTKEKIGDYFLKASENPYKGDWQDSLEERPNE